MPRSISGVYTLPETPFVAGTVIQSTPVNSDFSDIATALTQSLATTGVSSMTGPIKAASGSVTAPSYTFASGTGTGFYLSGTNEMSWTAAGVLAATFASNGAVTWVGAQTFQSTVSITGAFSVGGILTATVGIDVSSASVPAIFRNSTNNTSDNLVLSFFLGSGAGSGAGLYAKGTGANDVSQLAWFMDATEMVRMSATSFSPKKDVSIDAGITVIATAGYISQAEISTPSTPSADRLRTYTKDDGAGISRLFTLDSAGTERILLSPANQTLQEAATSNLYGVTPGTQVYHPTAIKAWVHWDASSGTPTIAADYGVSSLGDGGVGLTTVNFDTAFSAAGAYGLAGHAQGSLTTTDGLMTTTVNANTRQTTSFLCVTARPSNETLIDSPDASAVFFGDL